VEVLGPKRDPSENRGSFRVLTAVAAAEEVLKQREGEGEEGEEGEEEGEEEVESLAVRVVTRRGRRCDSCEL
jgi:hypothetical protein